MLRKKPPKTPDCCDNLSAIPLNETAYIKKCYHYLHTLKLVKTQYDFCEQYLSKSKNYLSMIETTNRLPSVNSLHHLISHLEETSHTYKGNEPLVYNDLMALIHEGRRQIYYRFLTVC